MQTKDQFELTKAFAKIFSGFQRGYGLYDPTSPKDYDFKHNPPTIELYQQHLEGKISLGIVPITDKGNCRFGALDLDDHKKDKNNILKFDYKTLLEKIKFLKLPLVVCRSKSSTSTKLSYCLLSTKSISNHSSETDSSL